MYDTTAVSLYCYTATTAVHVTDPAAKYAAAGYTQLGSTAANM